MRVAFVILLLAVPPLYCGEEVPNAAAPAESAWRAATLTLRDGRIKKGLVKNIPGHPLYMDCGSGVVKYSRSIVLKVEELPEEEAAVVIADMTKRNEERARRLQEEQSPKPEPVAVEPVAQPNKKLKPDSVAKEDSPERQRPATARETWRLSIQGHETIVGVCLLAIPILLWACLASFTASMAQRKGRDRALFFWLAFFFNPIPLIIVASLPDVDINRDNRRRW